MKESLSLAKENINGESTRNSGMRMKSWEMVASRVFKVIKGGKIQDENEAKHGSGYI